MNEKEVQLEIAIRNMVTPLANDYGVELSALVEAFKLGDAHGWTIRAEQEFAHIGTVDVPPDHGDPKDWVWTNTYKADEDYGLDDNIGKSNWFNEEADRARQSEIDDALRNS